MKFPTLVYKCPGQHACKGGTYNYAQVCNLEEFTAKIKDNWMPTLPAAMGDESFDLEEFIANNAGEVVEANTSNNSDITIDNSDNHTNNSPDPHPDFKDLSRKELEHKAKQLGISFNKNIKDETLAERIIQAMEKDDELD